jgi:hypothetical protein
MKVLPKTLGKHTRSQKRSEVRHESFTIQYLRVEPIFKVGSSSA